MSDVNDGELSAADDIAAARQEFLHNPPPIIDPDASEPVVDDSALEAEALEELTAPPAAPEGGETTPPPAPPAGAPDPYAQFGGEETVRQAYAVQEALRTEQGVRALVANGLTALGYDVDAVRAALDGTPPPAAGAPAAPAVDDPFAGLEDDDAVTVGSVKTVIERAVAEASQKAIEAATKQFTPVQEVVQQQQATAVRTATDAAVIEALGPVPTEPEKIAAYRQQVDAIVARGAAYYDPQQWNNPAHIRDAVIRANAEINAEAEQRYQAYLATKRAARDAQPVHVAGGAGGDGPLPEPKNLAEAREQAKASGFFK